MVSGVKNAGKSAISAIEKGISKAKEFVSTAKHSQKSLKLEKLCSRKSEALLC